MRIWILSSSYLAGVDGVSKMDNNTRILLSSDDGKKSRDKAARASYLYLKYIELHDKQAR